MQRAHKKHWKSETKTTCKERLKLITALISSGDNSKINGNMAFMFISWMVKSFWMCTPFLVSFFSWKHGAGLYGVTSMSRLWNRRQCGLVPGKELQEASAVGPHPTAPFESKVKSFHCSLPQFLCLSEKVFCVKDTQIFHPVTLPWRRRPPPPFHSLSSVYPLGHGILPQIPMSAHCKKKKRSCYGINLVLAGKV